MDKLTARINRSNSDHAALVSRSCGRRDSEKLPVKATQSVSNLSKSVAPKARSKFTVSSRGSERPVQKKLFPEAKQPPKVATPFPGRKFTMEKSLTMIELGSPSKQHQMEEQAGGLISCSTTALASSGQDRMGSNTSKLIYETGFKLLLKCWRDRKRQIDRLNSLLSHKDNNSIKYRNQLHTIQSLYQNECKNHESARADLRTHKQKLEALKSKLLDEKTAHLGKVSELEASLVQRDKFQVQLTHTEEELAKAILHWHGFEFKWKQQEDHCARLESEKQELLKQIDSLEENFKNFEKDYEKSLADQANSNKNYETRMALYQQKLEEANRQIEVYENDCQLLKEWNIRLAGELAQVKGAYQNTYTFRVRRFLTNLPRKPGFYVQYLLYLLVRGSPAPKIPLSGQMRGTITYPSAACF